MRFIRDPEVVFVVCVSILLALGCVMVFSATALSSGAQIASDSTVYIRKHLLSIGLGSILLIITRNVPIKVLYLVALPMFILSLVGLLYVLIPGLGHTAGGATRWIPVGPLRVQPGEWMKLGFALFLASYIHRHSHEMLRFIPGVVKPGMILLFPACLLLLQPDFGTTAILCCVVLCELLAVSRLAHLLGLAIIGAFSLGVLAIIEPYRMKRLQAFLDPLSDASASGYQLVQSLIAVGSGSFFGVGLGFSKQKLFYQPAAHTDFIFAVISEELGLSGALLVVILFAGVIWSGLQLSKDLRHDPFLSALAIGATTLLGIPAILNIGVVTGLLPTKGLVLPLVGYGGSAMMVNLTIIGILLNLFKIRRYQ